MGKFIGYTKLRSVIMKKIVIGTVFCILSLDTVCGMLVKQEEARLATFQQGGVGTTVIRTGEPNVVTPQREEVRYDSFELIGDSVKILFANGFNGDHGFVTKSRSERSYPYTKEFVGLQQTGANLSCAVYKLFANTEEVGRIELNDRFIDRRNPLPHQRRIVEGFTPDDDNLVSRGKVETYVTLDGSDRLIDTEANGAIPYTFLRSEKDPKYMDAPNGGDNVRIYARWNGDEVRRNWDGLALVKKPAPQPPAQAAAPQSGSVSSGGGYSPNLPEKIFQHIGDGSCNVM